MVEHFAMINFFLLVKRVIFLFLFLYIALIVNAQALYHAHAHNDYLKPNPLQDALKYHFKSVEADVFFYKNELKLAHVGALLSARKNLQDIYLQPLAAYITSHSTEFYPTDTAPFVLMVEFKNDKEACYQKLKELILPYHQLLSYTDSNNVYHPGKVSIVLTGGVPLYLVKNDKTKYFTIDGNVGDAGGDEPTFIIKRVSSPYFSFFKWMGVGKMPENEHQRLVGLVAAAHAKGRELRFYACPNNPKIWQVLLDAGVDWINIDRYRFFSKFYRKKYYKTE